MRSLGGMRGIALGAVGDLVGLGLTAGTGARGRNGAPGLAHAVSAITQSPRDARIERDAIAR